jgi:hypothetical protein
MHYIGNKVVYYVGNGVLFQTQNLFYIYVAMLMWQGNVRGMVMFLRGRKDQVYLRWWSVYYEFFSQVSYSILHILSLDCYNKCVVLKPGTVIQYRKLPLKFLKPSIPISRLLWAYCVLTHWLSPNKHTTLIATCFLRRTPVSSLHLDNVRSGSIATAVTFRSNIEQNK